jgi:ParB family chromosome partitioning protein
MQIHVADIDPNPEQPRREFDRHELEELAASMKEHGLINAIAVQPIVDRYYIIDGERRWRAAKLLGWETIEATVHIELEKRQWLIQALVANLQRADMNPVEEAQAYAKLTDAGLNATRISQLLSISTARISGRLKILELAPSVQELIAAGKVSKDPNVIKELLELETWLQEQVADRLGQQSVGAKASVASIRRIKDYINNHAADDGPGNEIPAVRFAHREPNLPAWDVYAQLKKTPPWETVKRSAATVCNECELRSMASKTTCQDCPLVEMLSDLMEAVC